MIIRRISAILLILVLTPAALAQSVHFTKSIEWKATRFEQNDTYGAIIVGCTPSELLSKLAEVLAPAKPTLSVIYERSLNRFISCDDLSKEGGDVLPLVGRISNMLAEFTNEAVKVDPPLAATGLLDLEIRASGVVPSMSFVFAVAPVEALSPVGAWDIKAAGQALRIRIIGRGLPSDQIGSAKIMVVCGLMPSSRAPAEDEIPLCRIDLGPALNK
jgi:hypothetical protein